MDKQKIKQTVRDDSLYWKLHVGINIDNLKLIIKKHISDRMSAL